MDFQTLSRRELQALCKKNKIPANITNVAMIDALNALENVEGIAEILNPSGCEAARSSMESPEKSERTSPNVPRTGCTVTRTRRTTRKMVAGEVEGATPAAVVAAQSTRRRAAATSVRRNIEMPLNESEEVDVTEKKQIPQTPVAVPSTRRRGVKETGGSVRNAYSTRRSVRLAEKTVEEKPRSEGIKIESFAEQLDEESVDSKEIGGIKEEKTNDMEIDATCDDNKDLEMSDESEVLAGDNVQTLLDMDNGVQENNGSEDLSMIKTENDVKSEMDTYEVSESGIADHLDSKTTGQSESEDGKSSDSDEVLDAQQIIEDEIHVAMKEDAPTEEIMAENAEVQSNIPREDHILECENPIKDEILSEGVEKFAGSETTDVLVSFAPPQLDFTGDQGGFTLPSKSSLTPVKKNSLSTTPIKKSPVKTPKTAGRMTIISEDREQPPMKIKEIAEIDNQKPSLDGFSLRQLTKMFKQKLEITKTLKTSKADDTKETNARPALKPLSQNCCIMGEPQN